MESQEKQLEQFVDCVQAIGRHMKRSQRNSQEGTEITKTQWLILRFLAKQDGCTIGQLAERLEVRSSSMSQMIDRLELAGTVYREPDKNDARTRIVKLTEAGKETISNMKHSRMEMIAGPFNQLTREEQNTLVEIMMKMTTNFKLHGSRCKK
ncbi:MarR family transcriptional regulator [Robertmurraya korlensis]|uniref:MarR family winged helix-turn-helix transcriptional regulator n=1 Tax=Robertmurraya korlensis TaxID=519977 RepID=UPI00203ABA2E|nr:MarR family transcriptional regulator [Robertmurraya korlensis]MCM3601659.1 MarR family transcriptional regulator [Robertmurraya korlensis]